MKTALILLSPFQFYDGDLFDDTYRMACDLKGRGIERADVACDPHMRNLAHNVARGYPVPDFDGMADQMTRYILRPVIGESDVVHIGGLEERAGGEQPRLMPDWPSLVRVGTLFAEQVAKADRIERARDGSDAGLAMFMAFHPSELPAMPDVVIWPHMRHPARDVLNRIDTRAIRTDLTQWGLALDLRRLRGGLQAIYEFAKDAAPLRRLHA